MSESYVLVISLSHKSESYVLVISLSHKSESHGSLVSVIEHSADPTLSTPTQATTSTTTTTTTTTSTTTTGTTTTTTTMATMATNGTILGHVAHEPHHSRFTEWFLNWVEDYHQIFLYYGFCFFLLVLSNLFSYIVFKMEKKQYFVSFFKN